MKMSCLESEFLSLSRTMKNKADFIRVCYKVKKKKQSGIRNFFYI